MASFHFKLSVDFSFLLNGSYADTVIRVGEGQNMKDFPAHSIILRARSPYFESALSANLITRENNKIIFEKPNITPTGFEVILNYFYTGNFDLSKQSGEDILKFLVASYELNAEELLEYTQNYLIENKTSWIKQNFDNVFRTAFKYRCKKLQDYCLDSICKDPVPFIISDTFPSLDKDILLGLLKRDDLLIKEVEIWKYLIKWGIEQINGDRTKWNDDDYETLKETLNELIPFIRFAEISRADFFKEVRPYKAVVPRHIYEEISAFYYINVLPKSMILLPRSTIINPNIATVIANWINGNDSAVLSPNNKYKFNLIYSMSRDGLNNVTFYNKCNKQGPFVVFVRVQSKKIYGGYNPIGYASGLGRWLSSTESFIFSFEDDQDMKIGRVINSKFNMYDDVNFEKLFNFGEQLYYDERNLHIKKSGKYNSITNDNYTTLPIEEIEVFNIIRYEKS